MGGIAALRQVQGVIAADERGVPDGKIIAVGVVSILGYDAYQLHVLRSAKIGLIGSQHTTVNRDVHTHVLEHKARGVALLGALEGDVLQR